MQEIFLARQPIVDHKENLFAFELLFRSCNDNNADVQESMCASEKVLREVFGDMGFANENDACVRDGTCATVHVMTNVFGEMGIAKVLGAHKGFINMDAQFLHSNLIELLPKQQIVLELLESIIIDKPVVRRCRELKQKGYSLSLDDVTCLSDDVKSLLDIVDIVKLDLTQIEPSQLPSLVGALRRYPVKLLAEKVETHEQARHCLELGFDMFQGYYFARPEVISGKRILPSQAALLRILALMMENTGSSEIELIFKEHPNLTYGLLRMVNSAASGLTEKIGTIKHGLMVIGSQALLRWVQLLLFSTGQTRHEVNPLMQLAATRGKFMELIAYQETGGDHDYADRSFMVGILSLLDTMLGMPLPEALEHMSLHEEVEAALLQRDGRLGECLTLCENLEQGNIASLQECLRDHHWLTFGNLNKAQMEAMAWANAITV